MARVIPVIEAVRARCATPISIDTAQARGRPGRGGGRGAAIWNDVTALRRAGQRSRPAAELGCDVVLMHMQGEPATMQDEPRYEDVVAEVSAFLADRAEAAMARGRGARADLARSRDRLRQDARAQPRPDRAPRADRRPGLPGAARAPAARARSGTSTREPTAPTDRLGGSLALALAGAQRRARPWCASTTCSRRCRRFAVADAIEAARVR